MIYLRTSLSRAQQRPQLSRFHFVGGHTLTIMTSAGRRPVRLGLIVAAFVGSIGPPLTGILALTTTATTVSAPPPQVPAPGRRTSPRRCHEDRLIRIASAVTRNVALAMATSMPDSGSDPRQLVQRGMQTFRQGDVPASIDLFDQAQAVDPSLRPFLWQRGLSYYYAERFQEASEQFRFDVKVNPLDVEEIVWDIASLTRLDPKVVPPPTMLSLPPGKKDRRRIMSTVYALFRGEATEHDLAVAGHDGSPGEEFYALFYLGLYCEACRGEMAKAENYMRAAVSTSYASGSGYGDYMTACARVHCHLRGWT